MLEDLDQFLAVALSDETGVEQVIASRRAVGVEADKFRDRRVGLAGRDGSTDIVDCGVLVQRVPDGYDRCAMTSAHARRPHHPDTIAEPGSQIGQQLRRAGKLAAEAV